MSTSGTALKLKSYLAEAQATGQALIAEGFLTQAQLDICIRQMASYMEAGQPIYLEQILVHNRFVTKDQLAVVSGKSQSGSQSSLFKSLLPMPICHQYSVFPLRVQNNVLEIKACKPLTSIQLEKIRQQCSVAVESVKVIPTDLVDIRQALQNSSDSEDTFEAALLMMKEGQVTGVMLRRAIDTMLLNAVKMRSSDIHLDKKPDPDAWISHRIDGSIVQSHLVPSKLMAAMFTRLKTEAGMDASDDRRAQDGRLSLKSQGRIVDFRVATQPIVGGETMTLRVLDPEALISLDKLFPNQPDMVNLFKSISQMEGKHGGIILFSGPTGSGKTTSLYALAQEFPRDTTNLISVENPVEYIIPFMRQVQLNALMDEQSVNVERSMLRQDPDILILGEIRDADTMQAALKFAESGHLVLASIHANDTAQTFERVMSFVDGPAKSEALYMLSNTLRVVVSQRLVKTLCTCAETLTGKQRQDEMDKAMTYRVPLTPRAILRRPNGCARCRNTGFFGRALVHETLVIPMDEKLRATITSMLSASVQNFIQVQQLSGVVMRTRVDTSAKMVEAGTIDLQTAIYASNRELE